MPLDIPPKPELWLPPKPAIIRSISDEDRALMRAAKADLQLGTFPNPTFVPSAGLLPVSAINSDLYNSSGNSTSYNPGVKSIGDEPAAGQTRDIYVFAGSSNSMPTQVNVNGSNILANAVYLYSGARHGVYRVRLDTGTTATFQVVYGTTQYRFGLAVYAVYNATEPDEPVIYHITSTSGGAVDVDAHANGAIIAHCVTHVGSGTRTHTWTGLSEDFDVVIESGDMCHSAGSIDTPAGGTISCGVTPSAAASGLSCIMLAVK